MFIKTAKLVGVLGVLWTSTSAQNITGGNIPQGTLAQEVAFAMVNAVDCNSCMDGLLPPLQKLANQGDGPFSEMLIEACLLFGDQPAPLCQGIAGMTGPQFARNTRGINVIHNATSNGETSHMRQLQCFIHFGLCPPPPPRPYDLKLPPLPKNPKKFESKGGKPLKIAQYSDVHIDRKYLPGSDTTCGLNICCRHWNGSSVGPEIASPAEPFGFHKCDSPVPLAMSLVQAIQNIPDINATVFTGDVSQGTDYIYTEAETMDNLYAWYAESSVLNPYNSLGNHDSSPTASFTYHPRQESDWIYRITNVWAKSIGREAADYAASHIGMYARVHPGTKLKFIMLNTIIYYQHGFMNYDMDFPPHDPAGQLQFLIDELKKSEDADERAWICGHIPFGKADTMVEPSEYLNQIYTRFNNTIAGSCFGHSHKEQFEIEYSDNTKQTEDNALSVLHITGAMTPTSGPPMFKTFEVDPDTYEVMDYTVHIANLSAPGYQSKPEWTVYLSARETYGPYVDPPLQPNEPMDAKFFHKLTVAFEKNDTLYEVFNAALTRGFQVGTCTGACKTKAICEMRGANSNFNCDPIVPGAFFNRRDIDEGSEFPPKDEHECGGQGLHSITRNIVGPLSDEKLNAALSKRDASNEWRRAFIDASFAQQAAKK